MTPERRNRMRFTWRLGAVLAVVTVGLLTMVATSQPRWEISQEKTIAFEQGEESKGLEISTSSKNMAESRSLAFSVEHNDLEEGSDWTLVLEGAEPEEKSVPVNEVEMPDGKKKLGFVQWLAFRSESGEKMPECSGSTCVMKATLKRSGEDLGAVEIKLRASTGARGQGDPPGGKSFVLKVME